MGKEETSYARTQLWTMALVYGLLGIVLLGFILLLHQPYDWQFIALFLLDSILFFGFGATLYAIYRMDREEDIDTSKLTFSCRHCGKRFSKERLWKIHERSCVEMKI